MKLILLSDLHGFLPAKKFVNADAIVIAGDIAPPIPSFEQVKWMNREFFEWSGSQDIPIVMIAGNHDGCLTSQYFSQIRFHHNIVYLRDSGTTISGVKFWGSPWTKKYGEWWFMLPDNSLKEKWDKIPADTNVLITHGPPYSIGDRVWSGSNEGSESLYEWIRDHNITLHVFGHIHEGRGQYFYRGFYGTPLTQLVNASQVKFEGGMKLVPITDEFFEVEI